MSVTRSDLQAHCLTEQEVMTELQSSLHGLSSGEARERLETFGRNTLPPPRQHGLAMIILRQFTSPFIYILIAAAIVSAAIGEHTDAGFIAAVLLLNAIIGTIQEYSAQRSASALHGLAVQSARVERNHEVYVIDAADLVPGDIVLLESGDKVAADLRLLNSLELHVNESLLTGESMAVTKQPGLQLVKDTPLADRLNMAYAGTFVARGRGRGIVTATGIDTELGELAAALAGGSGGHPPLLIRMQRFTLRVAMIVAVVVALLVVISLGRGAGLEEVFLMAVALAVSAIPEGLPVALTIALAIGMRRMAEQHVIVRRLLAVEALGSCTIIASDKTGTLTVNELTARELVFADERHCLVSGEGMVPEGEIIVPEADDRPGAHRLIRELCTAVALANEGFLGRRNAAWDYNGDTVDVALLVLAHKAGFIRPELLNQYPQRTTLPFESENRFSASVHGADGRDRIYIKGALEAVAPMCSRQYGASTEERYHAEYWRQQVAALAAKGYRVLAVASGAIELGDRESLINIPIVDLTMIGLVAFTDPLRPEAGPAVQNCHRAGIEVAMITGDHPLTAAQIGKELRLVTEDHQVISGQQLHETAAAGEQAVDRLVAEHRVYARIEPRQKLDIVTSLQRQGHFVAVTGDGANDAPAMRAAHVSIAMGRKGTDIARESADLIITDDNFASIVEGVRQGRVAYANVRKVIFLLVSTGAAEIVLFMLALFTALPLPLFAVQLLWLNLITNGIQDIALAFEKAEGDELRKPPRNPREGVFNRLMIERVLISACTMGTLAFALYQWLLDSGYSVEQARNLVLFLMVLFENVHVFNSRSETLSVFTHNPLRNPLLLTGTVVAQLVHIGATYTPGLQEILGVEPVTLMDWLMMAGLALVLLLVMELHKLSWRHRHG